MVDVIRLMPIIRLLKDIHYWDNGYYSKIFFTRTKESFEDSIAIGGILLLNHDNGDNGHIDVIGLTSEEQEVLKKKLPQYRFG